MKKSVGQQIGDVAEPVFRLALPRAWSVNEQRKDYAKDYLVEIGDKEGDLSGTEFFVQLKGQEVATYISDGKEVSFSLEKKHAAYYADKVTDLPVFLVVVELSTDNAYYQFVQPILLRDQSWRKQQSVTIRIPVANDLRDHAKLRQAVLAAVNLMRLTHPESITNAVAAHRNRVREIDPRFDVKVSLIGDSPLFHISPLEPVQMTLVFNTKRRGMRKRISDLFEKGALVEFKPGEVEIHGSKLFEPLKENGGRLRCGAELPGEVTLICKNDEAVELSRLAETTGKLTGGWKEFRYEGGLGGSPLSLKAGPFGPEVKKGSVKLGFQINQWNGQPLLQLAFFDRIFDFFGGLAKSSTTRIEAKSQGNQFFHGQVPLHRMEFTPAVVKYLSLIDKARKVARHFGVNPVWSLEAFDKDSCETAEDLHAIFFEGGLVEKMPNVSMTATCNGKTFRWDEAKKAKGTQHIRIASDWTYTLLGTEIPVGKLTHDYTEITMTVRKARKRKGGRRVTTSDVHLVLTGSLNSERTIRPGDRTDEPPNGST